MDIDWKNYSYQRHLCAVVAKKPHITVARDVLNIRMLDQIIDEATELQRYAKYVVIVPKDPRLAKNLGRNVPKGFLLGFSCPSTYGCTAVPPEAFDRPVHLLGGRPDVQRNMAKLMPVYSFDCNRFTLDAKFGDYFDGETFRPLGFHNYEQCLRMSLIGINEVWRGYKRYEP